MPRQPRLDLAGVPHMGFSGAATGSRAFCVSRTIVAI